MHQKLTLALSSACLFPPTNLNDQFGFGTFNVDLRPESFLAEEVQRLIISAPYGSTLILPAGICTVDRTIKIERNDIKIKGQGPEKTIFRLDDNIDQPLFVIGSTETTNTFQTPFRISNVQLSGMTLDGNRVNQNVELSGGDISCGIKIRNNCLTIRGADHVEIADVVTKSARSGGVVLEKHCHNIRIEGLESYDNHFDGFAGYETEQSEFIGLNLHNNRSAGVSVDIRFNNNSFQDCNISNNGEQGFFIRYSEGNRVDRTRIIGNGKHGVFLARAEGERSDANFNQFSNVVIAGSGSEGFRVNDNTCIGNSVRGFFADNVRGDVSYPVGLQDPQLVLAR